MDEIGAQRQNNLSFSTGIERKPQKGDQRSP